MASDGNLEPSGAPDEAPLEPALYQWVYWTSVVVGAVFGSFWVYVGFLKAKDPMSFLIDVRSFQLLDDPWAAYLALGLPWLEITCGLCLLVHKFYFAALLVMAGMLSVFLGAIFSAQSRGLDITCGCFGKSANATVYSEIILRDTGLIAITLLLLGSAFWLARARHRSPDSHEAAPSEDESHSP
jgi:putative oxidoreductase